MISNRLLKEQILDNLKTTVEALKRVSLLLTAGTTAGGTDLLSPPQPIEFIYGIGSRGLTGFEYELAGKRAGDEGAITFNEHNRPEIFGHILPCEIQSRLTAGQGYVQYRITDIAETTPTEVVRFMAAAVGGCGSGCGCGCDCGGN
jgi:hypothetical protein